MPGRRDIRNFLNRDVTDLFGRREITELLNRDVTEVFRSRKAAAGDQEPITFQDASLILRPGPTATEFVCSAPRLRFLSVAAQLAGAPSIVRAASHDKVPTLRLSVPVECDGKTATVEVLYCGEAVDEPLQLFSATAAPVEAGGQAFEFVFGDTKERRLYRFTIPEALPVSGFERVERKQPEAPSAPTVAQLAAVLRATLHHRGDAPAAPEGPQGILAALLRARPSPRVEAVLQAWHETAGLAPPPGSFDACARLLAALEAPAAPDTLLACCLYAEVEAGRVTPERMRQWLAGAAAPVLSPYTMQVVGAALDAEFIGIALPGGRRLKKSELLALLVLSPAGLLQGLTRDDAPEPTYRYAQAGMDLDASLPRGWRPSTEILLRPPILDRVSPADLRLLLTLGHSVYASFQSDLDRRRVWRRMTRAHAESDLTFLDGFRVFHFQSRIFAELVEVAQGADRGASPDIYRDDRGSLHMVAPGAPPPSGRVEKLALAVRVPESVGLPELLPEMAPELLLGHVDQGGADLHRLELLGQALYEIVTHPPQDPLALEAGVLRSLRERLDTPRNVETLRPVVDGRTLDFIKKNDLDPEKATLEPHLYEPVAQGLKHEEILDFVALSLVHELCTAEGATSASFHKSFDRRWLRAAVRNQMLALLESATPAVRQFGCRLLCTRTGVGDSNERPMVEYELKKQLEGADRAVALEAAVSLARLAGEEQVPLPPLWELRPAPENRAKAAADRRGGERRLPVNDVVKEIKAWHLRVSTMLGLVPPPRTGMPPPTAASAASSEGMMELARLVSAARACFGEEGEVAAGVRVMLTTEAFLKDALVSLMASFRDFGEAHNLSLRDVTEVLGKGSGLAAWLEHVWEQPDMGGLEWEASPQAPTWSYADLSDPRPLWILQESDAEGRDPRVSPFFTSLLQMALDHGAHNLRLCRMAGEAGGRVLPTAFETEVLNCKSVAFVPFVEEMQAAARMCLSVGEQSLLSIVIPRLQDLRAAGMTDAVSTDTRRLESREAPGDAVIDVESPEARRMARRLLDAFGVPERFLPQMLHILRDLVATAGRALW